MFFKNTFQKTEENKSISWGIKTKSHTAGNLQSLLVNRSQKLLCSTVLWEQDTVAPNIHCRMFTSNSACTAGTSSSYTPKNVIMSSAPQLYKYGGLLEPSERKGNDNTSWYRKRTHKQTRLEDKDVTARGSTIYLDCRSEHCRRILQDPSHALFPVFEWLPSGCRLRCLCRRTHRRRATVVHSLCSLVYSIWLVLSLCN